jgi:hypothetical protein
MPNLINKISQGFRLLGMLLGVFTLLIGFIGIAGFFRYFLDSTQLRSTLFALTMFVVFAIYGVFLLVPFRFLRPRIPVWLFGLVSLIFCIRIPFGFAAVAPLGGKLELIAFWSGILILLSILQFVIFAWNRIPESGPRE